MLRVILKRGKSKPFWLGHPWVFSGAVEKVVGQEAKQGGECVVIDERDNVLGWGHYNPHARIAVRILEHRRTTEVPFNPPTFKEFLAQRLGQAQAARERLGFPNENTNAYRLVNAEGDGLSGLIVDVFGTRAVMQLNSRPMAEHSEEIARLVMQTTNVKSVKAIVSSHGLKFEGIPQQDRLFGETFDTDACMISENGVRYELNLGNPQKTGFYLDQRDNRQLLATLASGRSFLDLYCHAGGFGLNALLAGATSATFVDTSEPALDMVRRNLRLNDRDGDLAALDAVSFLKGAIDNGQSWDVVSCDPPKFVRARSHRDDGLKKYARLNQLALSVLKPGGVLLTCSCSEHINRDDFLRMLTEAAHRLRRSIRIHQVSGQSQDHPYISVAAQSDYLKAFLVTLI